MPAVIAKMRRENLYQEIFDEIRQWPELERRIFSEAHYHGQSVYAISGSLHLDVEEVTEILKQCDRRLHSSLRDFRKTGCEKPARIPANAACPIAREQELKTVQTLAFAVKNNPDASPISV